MKARFKYLSYLFLVASCTLIMSTSSNLKADDTVANLLTSAIENGDTRALDFLFSHGVNVNHRLQYYNAVPLIAAVRRGDKAMVETILKYHPNLNDSQIWTTKGDEKDRYRTALMAAAELGDMGLVKILVQHGADVSFRIDVVYYDEDTYLPYNVESPTAAEVAEREGHKAIAAFLQHTAQTKKEL